MQKRFLKYLLSNFMFTGSKRWLCRIHFCIDTNVQSYLHQSIHQYIEWWYQSDTNIKYIKLDFQPQRPDHHPLILALNPGPQSWPSILALTPGPQSWPEHSWPSILARALLVLNPGPQSWPSILALNPGPHSWISLLDLTRWTLVLSPDH